MGAAGVTGAAGVRVKRIRVHGVDLEVLTGGEGPTAVLLHGPTVYSPDAPFLELLGRHASIVAPSHPGFGGSSRPDDFDTVYDLIHFYQGFLDTLPDERVTLIGCSFGGWLAAEIAVNYRHRLDRLVLVDPVGIKVGGREERDIVHHFNTSPAELARLAWHDPSQQRPGLLGLGWQQHLDAMSDAELTTTARGWDALCLYAWRPHLFNPKLKRWLHRIVVPTLLLWGASDRIVAPGYGRAYADLIPGSRLEVIPEAGHHPELEQPEAFVERVARFLRA
jgi:pimeloyl-ACP methyl ester carboxylesterase